jgi:hypothetical protein
VLAPIAGKQLQVGLVGLHHQKKRGRDYCPAE